MTTCSSTTRNKIDQTLSSYSQAPAGKSRLDIAVSCEQLLDPLLCESMTVKQIKKTSAYVQLLLEKVF